LRASISPRLAEYPIRPADLMGVVG
jgi:hypothetical protein